MTKPKKKVLFCFYKGDISNDICILEDLDSKGFEINLFNDVDESNLKIDILPDIVKEFCKSKEYEYDIFISSNIKEFIMLQYILYSDLISAALYLNKNPVTFKVEKLYELILKGSFKVNSSNFYILREDLSIFNNCPIFKGDFQADNCSMISESTVYNFQGSTHIFSINKSENINIINLDDSEFKGFCYYHFNLNYLDEFLEFVSQYTMSINRFMENYQLICDKIEELKKSVLGMHDFEKGIVKFRLENELNAIGIKDSYKIFLISLLLNVFDDQRYLELIMHLLIKSKSINKYSKFFIYYQCVRYIFVNKNVVNESVLNTVEKLYSHIFEEFYYLTEKYKFTPKEERDKQSIIVFTTQFLSIEHAPTKLALDVCYNLVKGLNKKVIIIDTEEVLTMKGLIPLAKIIGPNDKNINNVNAIVYKDIKIPFCKPDVKMPDEYEIDKLLNMVSEIKPELIINIGTCLVGDLCTNIAPTVTIPLGNNGHSMSTFYVVNDENEYEQYSKMHKRNMNSIIINKFAFEINKKKSTFTKEQLGIPRNKFIIAVIGNRLNEEIDEEFLDLLEKCCKHNNTFILFIDKFDFKQTQISKYNNLISNCKCMGHHKDLLSVVENIDLYVNPKRSGGGTSAIYALYAGKPVVTLNFGDVAKNVGEEFCVDNYIDMYGMICKYCCDKEFYDKQGFLSKEKAMKLTDMSRYVDDLYYKITKKY